MTYLTRKEALISDFQFLQDLVGIKLNPPLLYLGGWLGNNNLGDEALLDAMRRRFDQFHMLHFDPSDRSKYYICKLLGRRVPCIIAGGTLINRISQRWIELARISESLFKNISVFGTGVASPDFWGGREGWKDNIHDWIPILEKCNYLGVRGPISKHILTNAGIVDVEIIGDPVLQLAKKPTSRLMGHHEKVLGVNIGIPIEGCWGTLDQIIKSYSEIINLAKKDGWKIHWFVVYPPDLELTMSLANETGTTECITTCYHNADNYMNEVSEVTAFIGLKLHATALALCALVPSIMVEYQPKCRDFMLSIEEGLNCFRSDEVQVKLIWEMLQDFSYNRTARSMIIYNKIRPLQKLQQDRCMELSIRYKKLG